MRRAAILLAIGVTLVFLDSASRSPAQAPRRGCATVTACHRAIAWQRGERARLGRELARRWRRDADYAVRLAARTFQIDEARFRRVAYCESRLDPTALEPTTHAAGLLQWLPSSWAAQGIPGFSVYDPVANALAAARTIAHDGGYRQWSCRL